MLTDIFYRDCGEQNKRNFAIVIRNTVYDNAFIFKKSLICKRMKLGLINYSATLNEDYCLISNLCFVINMDRS